MTAVYCLTLHPSWLARNLILDPNRRSVPLLPGSPSLLGYVRVNHILLHGCVALAEVNAEVQTPILLLGHIAPTSNISFICAHTFSTISGGICLNLSLNSSSSITLIPCHVRSIQPNSHESRGKISWYYTRSEWAATLFLGVQESRPLKTNCSQSTYLCCSTVIFGLPNQIPWAASNYSTVPSST